jgi:hypothetical protein
MKQTSVDFAFEKLANQGLLVTKDYKNLVAYREAKEMEKERMIEFAQLYAVIHCMGDITKNVDEYYRETFNPKEK